MWAQPCHGSAKGASCVVHVPAYQHQLDLQCTWWCSFCGRHHAVTTSSLQLRRDVLFCAVLYGPAGGLFSAPQQYMQQRVSWFKTNMTGGTMSALFNISNHYGEQGRKQLQRSGSVQDPAVSLLRVHSMPSVSLLYVSAQRKLPWRASDESVCIIPVWLQDQPDVLAHA